MSSMRLDIITVEREIFSDEVDMILAPGSDGELGILPFHAPLMTTIQPGELLIRRNGEDTYLAVSGGFLEVMGNVVTILAETAEQSDEIDEDRARLAIERAQDRMAMRISDIDLQRATAAFRRAQVRQRVARRRHRRETPASLPSNG